MQKSHKEKYLGDFLTSSGDNKATLTERIAKGYAVVSEIKSILTEIPLGRYKIDVGLKLRQAMFINSVLFNSEAWHGIRTNDINRLEKVDERLLLIFLAVTPNVHCNALF